MSQRKLRFALFGKKFQENKLLAIRKILDCLSFSQADIYIERDFYHYLCSTLHLNVPVQGVFERGYFDVDFVVSVGGDGTFLRAASQVGSKGTPIIGVNTGRLGFLADVLPGEIETAFSEILCGNYCIENHSVIQVTAEGDPLTGNPYALNDIAVLKRDNASMISVRTCVNGEYLVTYQADGLLISTPTGSTAYNLSNGGPIIVPNAHNLCITPVAPHSLNIRPIVVNDDCVVTLEVESRSRNFLVAVDGRSEKRLQGSALTIRKAPFDVRIVKRSNQRYFSTLREKMMWGADQR